ncbi:MAG: ABC transporter permease [Desulfobacteraceae bacterium]
MQQTITLDRRQSTWTALGATSRRGRAMWMVAFSCLLLAALYLGSRLMDDSGLETNFMLRNHSPSATHLFGTDWLGRDMFTRTIKGLCLSLGIGMVAAACSTVIALTLGLSAAVFGKKVDALVTGLIDVMISTPHLVLLILISFAVGGGGKGVIIAVAATHWTRLARIVRAEVLQLKNAEFVQLSKKLGRRPVWICRHHLLPHLFPQFFVGLILLFPHAIMHAAGLTFLGFGLSPHTPAIGVLLSEAMRHLSTGYWWLAVPPGLMLLIFVKLFDLLGNGLRYLLDPKTSQE